MISTKESDAAFPDTSCGKGEFGVGGARLQSDLSSSAITSDGITSERLITDSDLSKDLSLSLRLSAGRPPTVSRAPHNANGRMCQPPAAPVVSITYASVDYMNCKK